MHKLTKTLDSRGFTLIEILVSVTILGLMTLGTVSFSEFVINRSDNNVLDDRDFLQVETAMSRLEFDISQIYSPLYFDILMNPSGMTPEEGEIYNQLLDAYQNNQRFSQISYNGLPVPIFENPEKDELIILTMSNRRKIVDTKQSRFAWIRYSLAPLEVDENDDSLGRVESEESKSKFALVRQTYGRDVFNPQEIPWDRVKTQILMRNVEAFKFEFWNPEVLKWTENIDTVKQGIHRIYAVKVSIQFYDFENNERYTERIYRPLFPEFQAENIYKFLKPPKKNPNREGVE